MSPFEWSMFSVPGVKLSIEPQGAGNTLSATTDGTASGTIVRQSLALPPGPHSLTFTGTMPPAAHEGFGWSITCRNRKTVLNTVRVPSPPPYRFDVPRELTSIEAWPGCRQSPRCALAKLCYATSPMVSGLRFVGRPIDADRCLPVATGACALIAIAPSGEQSS
jgi:hypothetical protein